MTITKIQENEKLTFALAGRLNTTTAPLLQDSLIPAFDEIGDITLNFSQLTYVSSAGLRVLLMGQKTAKAKGVSMTITGVSDNIMEVLDMTGFSDMLTIV